MREPTAPAAAPALSLADVFTPTRPKLGRRSLIGRQAELNRAIEALLDEHAHVVIYAERGRGKTSLANSIVEVLRSRNVAVARYICSADTSYDDILHGLARDLPTSLLAVPASERAGLGCEAAFSEGPLGPSDVVVFPSRLTCWDLVFVIDEFDRVDDQAVRQQMADTIKQVSDRGARLRFMIIGVSDSLNQLADYHPSIRRNVVNILLPLLHNEEIRQIVVDGARKVRYELPPELVEDIVALARGLPYIAQLLGLRVTQATAARKAKQANAADLRRAVERLVQDTDSRVVTLYMNLTLNGTDAAMTKALQLVASTDHDNYGRLQGSQEAGQFALGRERMDLDCGKRLIQAGILVPLDEGITFKMLVGNRDLVTYVTLRMILNVDTKADLKVATDYNAATSVKRPSDNKSAAISSPGKL